MDFKDPRFLLEVFILLWQLALTGVLWLRKPGEDAGKAVEQLRTEMDANHMANQLESATLRERIAHMPTDEELAELAGNVKALASGQDRMGVQLNRIEQYLLNQK